MITYHINNNTLAINQESKEYQNIDNDKPNALQKVEIQEVNNTIQVLGNNTQKPNDVKTSSSMQEKDNFIHDAMQKLEVIIQEKNNNIQELNNEKKILIQINELLLQNNEILQNKITSSYQQDQAKYAKIILLSRQNKQKYNQMQILFKQNQRTVAFIQQQNLKIQQRDITIAQQNRTIAEQQNDSIHHCNLGSCKIL